MVTPGNTHVAVRLFFAMLSILTSKLIKSVGYPGSLGYEKKDAALFASFGIDYLKYGT